MCTVYFNRHYSIVELYNISALFPCNYCLITSFWLEKMQLNHVCLLLTYHLIIISSNHLCIYLNFFKFLKEILAWNYFSLFGSICLYQNMINVSINKFLVIKLIFSTFFYLSLSFIKNLFSTNNYCEKKILKYFLIYNCY